MRSTTLLLVLTLAPALGCPRPTDTEAASVGAPKPEPEPGPEAGAGTAAPEEPETTTAEPGPGAPATDAILAIEPARSSVGFAVARATIGHVGSFERFDAKLTLAEGRPAKLEIEVETGSVVADRTGLTHHLKGADFFEVEKFPTATFAATEFEPDPEAGPDAYTIRGTMRLHGVTSTLEFPATIEIGPEEVVGRATVDISAKAFGIDYAGMEAELAEDAVQLEIELVFPRVGP